MTEQGPAELRARAERVRSGIDAALDIVNDLSSHAPDAEAARALQNDAFRLVEAFRETAELLCTAADLLESATRSGSEQ